MDETKATRIEQIQAGANTRNQNEGKFVSAVTNEQQQTNHKSNDDMPKQNISDALILKDFDAQVHSNSDGKADSNNSTVGCDGSREVTANNIDESLIPSLVNSSFDSTENSLLSPNSHIATGTIIDRTSSDDAQDIGNVLCTKVVCLSSSKLASVTTTALEEDEVEEDNNSTDIRNHHIVTSISDHVKLLTDTTTTGIDVDDRLQGFLNSDETPPMIDIDTLYAEACQKIVTSKEINKRGMDVPLQQQQQLINDEHSESLTESFYSCRDGASASDNMTSDVSFHTALDNQFSSTNISISQSANNIDDFLSCRSGEEPSSHLFDLSSSRIDGLQSEQDSSLQSYHTCRKFNRQGLISILKKGGVDNECTPGKNFRIPLDILIKEGINSSSSIKSMKNNRRNKYLCCTGLIVLTVLTATAGIVLITNQRPRNTNSEGQNEKGYIQNNTITVTTLAPHIVPSHAPTRGPAILTVSTDMLVSIYPSCAPSIQPTTPRHHDNVFLRPTKKKSPRVKVKANNTM